MTHDLTTLMREATDGLQPPPDLLAVVRRGGRRRLARRRSATGALALLAALAVPVAVVGAGSEDTTSATTASFAGPLGDGRTHGNLAEDDRYLAEIKAVWSAWRNSHPWREQYSKAAGDVRVLWAGTTPAGPAALLAQQIDVPHGIGGITGGTRDAHAYIGTGADGPRVAHATFSVDGRMPQAWYVDPAHRVLAVVDSGRQRGITYRWEYEPNGTARRTFAPLKFTDGISIAVLPDGIDRYTVHVADLPFRTHGDLVGIANVELDGEAARLGLHWNDPARQMHLLLPIGDAEQAIGSARDTRTAQRVASEVQDALDANTHQAALTTHLQDWIVYGRTHDGRQVRVFERQLDNDPARLYALLDGDLLDYGPIDRAAALPVQVDLPDGVGWIVAQYGADLEYRTASSGWTDAGRDAALLPASATAARVVTSERTAIIPLG
jgi:hypothetical protein